MSVDFDTINGSNPIQRSGFIHGMPSLSVCDLTDTTLYSGDRRVREDDSSDSCSSSSIGRNSDSWLSSSADAPEIEVQSSFKGLNTMDALEAVLPIKRRISKFYIGKSKSFASLADASSASSVHDLAKPENPYTRKRKNLLAHTAFWDKTNNNTSQSKGGGISKRPANVCRSTIALGLTSNTSDNNTDCDDRNSVSVPPSSCLPPLHPIGQRSLSKESPLLTPRRNSTWRSFSVSDCSVLEIRYSSLGQYNNNA